MLFRHGQFFTALLLSVGIGLLGYYGIEYHELPKWSAAAVDESVELNLAMDLKRRGPHLQPQGERLEDLRRLVRREVETEIAKEREHALRGLFSGCFALLVAWGHWRFTRRVTPHA